MALKEYSSPQPLCRSGRWPRWIVAGRFRLREESRRGDRAAKSLPAERYIRDSANVVRQGARFVVPDEIESEVPFVLQLLQGRDEEAGVIDFHAIDVPEDVS